CDKKNPIFMRGLAFRKRLMKEQQERSGILSTIYYSANDIAQMLGISKSGAYSIIRKLNGELESRGFIVIQGKVSKAYFEEKWYGLNV
ncbi:MAG: hypothetical protein OSJ73_23810, partial [Lachnospiraceae bacterium]|nr:hypothetical protein [Lachnospiraceae bacterium]